LTLHQLGRRAPPEGCGALGCSVETIDEGEKIFWTVKRVRRSYQRTFFAKTYLLLRQTVATSAIEN
jgi:hypothetical protein